VSLNLLVTVQELNEVSSLPSEVYAEDVFVTHPVDFDLDFEIIGVIYDVSFVVRFIDVDLNILFFLSLCIAVFLKYIHDGVRVFSNHQFSLLTLNFNVGLDVLFKLELFHLFSTS
jgi:hypothetical protein